MYIDTFLFLCYIYYAMFFEKLGGKMISDIDTIFSMLKSSNDKQTQSKGIEEAKKVKQISVFFMPKGRKEIWENCARIISEKSDAELEIYLYDMFVWLQDMCWPGADIIYDRLKKMTSEHKKHMFDYCLNIAKKTNDKPWEESLLSFMKDQI